MRKVKTRKSVKKEDYEDLIYYKLKSSRFKQQRLPAWRPVPTFFSIIIFYILFAIIFIAIGILLLAYSGKIVSIEYEYHKECEGLVDCEISFKIEKDMERPILIYYKLDGFFQNLRRYVKSKSLTQLTGESTTLSDMESSGDCGPIYTNEDLRIEKDQKAADNETLLVPKEVAIPCGLIAKTYFNDTYKEWKVNDESFTINEKDIAWEKDKDIFKNYKTSKQWIDMQDEHFIVWMRTEGLPNFKKLWGRIEDRDLKKGDEISLKIENNYKVSHYEGGKSLILTTANKFGGKNNFMGVCFIVIGAISLLLGIAFPFLILQRNKHENNNKND